MTAQNSPPHKGFDIDQMISECRRSLSNNSDEGEENQTQPPTPSGVQSPQKKTRPRPLSSPHPQRARTRSSPNPVLRWSANKKVKGEEGGGRVGGDDVDRRVPKDSLHPDKRFSTGEQTILYLYCGLKEIFSCLIWEENFFLQRWRVTSAYSSNTWPSVGPECTLPYIEFFPVPQNTNMINWLFLAHKAQYHKCRIRSLYIVQDAFPIMSCYIMYCT